VRVLGRIADRLLRLAAPTTTASAACEYLQYYQYKYEPCPGGQKKYRRLVTIHASCNATYGPWVQITGCIPA
jgi:hypothetical protein